MNPIISWIALMIAATIARADDSPVVGAIRWDAWTGGSITGEVARSLGPEKYHNRLPWFAEVADGQVVKMAHQRF